MKKYFVALIFIGLVTLLFLAVNLNRNTIKSQQGGILENSSYQQSNSIINIPKDLSIDLQELTKHNTSTNCWVVYKNKVYDVSEFIPNHPGGEGPIARSCGTTNFEAAFQKKHGTSKSDLFMKVTTYKGEFIA